MELVYYVHLNFQGCCFIWIFGARLYEGPYSNHDYIQSTQFNAWAVDISNRGNLNAFCYGDLKIHQTVTCIVYQTHNKENKTSYCVFLLRFDNIQLKHIQNQYMYVPYSRTM